MDGAYSTHVKDEKCLQNYVQKIWKEHANFEAFTAVKTEVETLSFLKGTGNS
jgi:hypothetical protein